jgi:RNA polymerase primary sigma factor
MTEWELKIYKDDIGKYPLLSADEEKELAVKIKSGDQQALQRLINCNLRLVFTIAGQYAGTVQKSTGISLEDLIQEGNIGLMTAAEKFDGAFGTRFSTYASQPIKQRIRKALGQQQQNIRMSNRFVDGIKKCNKATDELCQKFYRRPTMQEIADFTGIPAEKVEILQTRSAMFNDDNTPIDDEERFSVLDTVADERLASVEEEVENVFLRKNLFAQINKLLGNRERRVMAERYGYNEEKISKTYKEIGDDIHMSLETVRKDEKNAIKKLQKFNIEHGNERKI